MLPYRPNASGQANEALQETLLSVSERVFQLWAPELDGRAPCRLLGRPSYLRVKGVGWAETANICHLVDDNSQ